MAADEQTNERITVGPEETIVMDGSQFPLKNKHPRYFH